MVDHQVSETIEQAVAWIVGKDQLSPSLSIASAANCRAERNGAAPFAIRDAIMGAFIAAPLGLTCEKLHFYLAFMKRADHLPLLGTSSRDRYSGCRRFMMPIVR